MNFRKAQKLVFFIFIIFVIFGLVIYPLFIESRISIDDFREMINNSGVWAPLIFILIYIIGTIFIPSTPFMLFSGIAFGFKAGLIYTIIGGIFSSISTFYISRFMGQSWTEEILKNKYLGLLRKYNNRLERGGIVDLIILRILPIMPFNILNILMGISRMSVWHYTVGTLIGLLPSNMITVYIGILLVDILN